jgi:hypothetical protein
LKQSVAEALFTIIYAGGPRVFQKALIEARKRILNIQQEEKISKPIEKISKPEKKVDGAVSDKPRYFSFPNTIIKIFRIAFGKADKEKKSSIKKKQRKLG